MQFLDFRLGRLQLRFILVMQLLRHDRKVSWSSGFEFCAFSLEFPEALGEAFELGHIGSALLPCPFQGGQHLQHLVEGRTRLGQLFRYQIRACKCVELCLHAVFVCCHGLRLQGALWNCSVRLRLC